MTTWFTADLHFGHTNIITYSDRPFSSVEEMNAAIIDRWNDTVAPDDAVFVLGDVCMGKIAETLPLCELLNGTKTLVPGNHDRCWTGHRKVGPWPDRYRDVGFFIEENQFRMELRPGLVAHVCHFPYVGDSHDTDRFDQHRPTDDGSWLLHGHVHEKWRVNGKMINVGVDVWDFTPVSLEQILEVIDG